MTSPARQLAGFLAKFSPDVASQARACVTRLRRRLPGACVLVYDNYNALAIGFGPTDRASDAIFSIAVFPRWVSLFFMQGARLSDPQKLLKGSGKRVRHIVLKDPKQLDASGVRALIAQALRKASVSMTGASGGRLVIKSVSARQRPRRPPPSKR